MDSNTYIKLKVFDWVDSDHLKCFCLRTRTISDYPFRSFQDLRPTNIILTEVHFKGLTCVTRCDSDNSCQVTRTLSSVNCIVLILSSCLLTTLLYRLVAQNPRKLCLCDGLCGLSCIRPEKECPELADPPSGQVGK